jgi:hypothetical protein
MRRGHPASYSHDLYLGSKMCLSNKSTKPRPQLNTISAGNVEAASANAPASAELRSALNAWTEAEISQWTSLFFVTLNLRLHIVGDAGENIRCSDSHARAAVKRFGNRIDRAAHGNLVQRFGTRVRRIPFLEYGHDRGWHCHVAIEMPTGMIEPKFRNIIQNAWTDNEWCSGLPDIRAAETDIAGYLTKFRSKSPMESWSDTIILEAVVTGTKYPTFPA